MFLSCELTKIFHVQDTENPQIGFLKIYQFYQNSTSPNLKVDIYIFLLSLSFPHFIGHNLVKGRNFS